MARMFGNVVLQGTFSFEVERKPNGIWAGGRFMDLHAHSLGDRWGEDPDRSRARHLLGEAIKWPSTRQAARWSSFEDNVLKRGFLGTGSVRRGTRHRCDAKWGRCGDGNW